MKIQPHIFIVCLVLLLTSCKPAIIDTPPLTIHSAAIGELPPVDLKVKGRKIGFSIELSKLPVCNKRSKLWQFGFLIDADRDSATGLTDTAYSDLGVDAGIVVKCNPDSGNYVSNIGQVTIRKAMNKITINIETVAEALPSVHFYYLAFAHDTKTFIRLPASPHSSAWAINEIRRY